jgi:predicted Zn finger-like uncharacterized protein
MKIVCDACSAKYSIADEKVRGKVFKIRCKKCSNIIVVRGAAGEAGAEQPAGVPFEKETKVFDYSGYDGSADASSPGDDQVWHLVIDQEQVGPMTVAEVKERFDRGEIDSESYVWREGFGDWERLADVDAFAGVFNGAGGEASGALFGGDDGRTMQSDPADLFAARGGDEDAGGASNDLFAGGAMAAAAASASASDEEDGGLFGSAGGGMAAAAAASPAKAAKAAPSAAMTGQRNENSVLFSLNNLAALASDSPRASAPSSSSSSASSSSSSMASGSSAGMAQGEGSGLIDIRSMAQVYLGDSPARPAASKPGIGSADDLPVFSQTSFESASPVLLPTAQPAVNNRLLFALVGLIGVLVIAAVILVVVVLKGDGDKDGGTKVAAADSDDKDEIDRDKADTTATQPATTPPAGGETPPAGTPPAGGETPPAATPPAEKSGTVGKKSSDDKDKDRGSSRDRGKSSSSSSSSSKPADKPVEKKPPPDPLQSSGCDEVTCLVEPDKACCRKGGSRKSSSSSSSSSADPNLPERPSRSDVSGGMSGVKGRVSSCGSKHGGKGTVMVKIKISSSGGVSSASASGGNSGLASCVESAVRGAKFPKSQLGITVNYPFVF